jgi:hypothetical protein
MTAAHHDRRRAAKAVRQRSTSTGHQVSVARSVLDATKEPERVRLLCESLGWQPEKVLRELDATKEADV